MRVFERKLVLPSAGVESFFLWGPRQVGKTTLLQQAYPEGGNTWIDLLDNEQFRVYSTRPETLRQDLEGLPSAADRQIVIDEIQRVPELLSEVHWLIENRGLKFALCGSSARRLRRRGVHLLGGRAVRYELRGLTAAELGPDFDLTKLLNSGYFPSIYGSEDPRRMINAYVSEYLRHEIADEGLARRLDLFSDFLDAAAFRDGAVVNYANIGQECARDSKTVKNYFDILEDTLMGTHLPAYQKHPKSKHRHKPKFYFADVGVVNNLAKRGAMEPGSSDFGKAFENWVFHELTSYIQYRGLYEELRYWRHNSAEVDFLLSDSIAVEAKAKASIGNRDLGGLRKLASHLPSFTQRVVASLVRKPYSTEDGIAVLPAKEFVEALWGDRLSGRSDVSEQRLW